VGFLNIALRKDVPIASGGVLLLNPEGIEYGSSKDSNDEPLCSPCPSVHTGLFCPGDKPGINELML
tara:strand:- start:247 stop:444 length:198 start_codon:yes stop_codon:yes gene_type:complete